MKRVLIFLFLCCLIIVPQATFALTEKGYKKLHVFTTVLHALEDSYVDEIDEEAIISGAISGMLDALDPHTLYMSPEIYRELKVDTKGRFDGIGIEVTVRNNVLTVVSPIKGSPAEKSGVETGDQIVSIDGKPTEKMTLTEAVRMMRGKRGTSLHLLLKRQGVTDPLEVSILRDRIRVPSVRAELLEGKYGYISISSFQQDTVKSLRKSLDRISHPGALEGLLLDLRRNPGGLLDEAIAVSDLFLESGVIVSTESRGQEIDRQEAMRDGFEPGYPMIILVDGGSASASEIVAGALQDNKRAVLLGTQTFGKGSVQTVIDLGDGGGLKLTVARYYTPSGRSIQASGITPDIVVPAKRPPEESRTRIREEDLKGHLKGDTPSQAPKLVTDDYQKEVALDYLKSWSLFRDEH